MDLAGGIGETSPSHSVQAVASLPCPEDLLDAGAHAMDRLIPFMELAERFSFVAAPHAGDDDAGNAALCQHGVTKVIAAIGAVGKHLTWIVGQGIETCFAVIDIGDVIDISSTKAVSASAPTWALNREQPASPYVLPSAHHHRLHWLRQ